MCNNKSENISVPIFIEDDYVIWDIREIDSCLVPTIKSLNEGKIYTASCCCGHGKQHGHIWLHDGRKLIIIEKDPNLTNEQEKDQLLEMLKKK